MRRTQEFALRVPGLALATGIAIVATAIGHFAPLVGGPVSGIVIGVVLATVLKPGLLLRPGIRVASTHVLQLSVVVLGSQLSLAQIAKVGLESLPVMLGTLAACLVAAWFIGKWLGIVGNLRTLIGVGTGVCGASAIAAVTPVIGAVGIEVTYAISTIFLFNIGAVLLFPVVGHMLGLSQHAFGLFAGTAVNDMSSVVATAATYGTAASNYAVVVKLVRTLMIIPISFGLAAWARKLDVAADAAGTADADAGMVGTADVKARATLTAEATLTAPSGAVAVADPLADPPATAVASPFAPPTSAAHPALARVHPLRLIPWFLIGFVIVAAINSAGLIPAGMHPGLSAASVFLITIALSAVGLSTDLAGFRKAGPRPLILGAALWIIVSVTSLGLQFATGLN